MTNGPGPRSGDGPHRRINVLLRLGRRFHLRGWHTLSKVMDLVVRLVFSADIPSRMPLPHGVTFMHNGLGTVVDEHVVFDGPALVFQRVTLGYTLGRSGGVPHVGRHVVIASGAVVVGDVRLGDGCFIGANAVVTRDVAAGDVVRSGPVMSAPLRTSNVERFWPTGEG